MLRPMCADITVRVYSTGIARSTMMLRVATVIASLRPSPSILALSALNNHEMVPA
jgi:hypothetical protein